MIRHFPEHAGRLAWLARQTPGNKFAGRPDGTYDVVVYGPCAVAAHVQHAMSAGPSFWDPDHENPYPEIMLAAARQDIRAAAHA